MKKKSQMILLLALVLFCALITRGEARKPLPDVIVESVAMSPSLPLPGQEVTFSCVIRNIGSGRTPPDVTVGVGYFVDGVYATWGTDPGPLAPGESVAITTQGGPWTATEGDHTLTAVADDVNRIQESDESNNSRSIPFTVPSSGLPDVVVESVEASPSAPVPGQKVTFSSVVRNIGGGSTPSGVEIGVGYLVDGAYATWGTDPGPLAPGESLVITTQRGPWTATEGDHTLTAVADDINRFEESDESNNSGSAPLFVAFLPPPPDGYVFGMNIDPANPAGNPTPQELKAIGVRWVRIEWKADRGYAFYDPVISVHRAAGLRVLLLVDYCSVPGKPSFDAGETEWTSYVSVFTAGVEDIAMHYADGIDAWQIWNEPDLVEAVPGYDPRVPADHFGVMLRDAVEAIRPYSTRPIVTGGLVSGDATYLTLARDAAGGLTVDSIGVHPYGQRAPDNWPKRKWGFGNMTDFFDRYLTFGLPLWVSEIGTADQSVQADYLENVYTLVQDQYADEVPVVFWFCWSDGMVWPFGVLTTDGQPKDSYWRYEGIAHPW